MKLKLFFITVLSFLLANTTFSQCPYGTINTSVWGTPDDFTFGFTADSDITDEDTVQVIQGEDTIINIQYLLPKKQVITSPFSGTATVNSVQILGVTGLPIGMNWRLDSVADANSNTYYPQVYRYGTVTLCGTTFSTPGIKTITVSVIGCGTMSGITDCAPSSFPLYIEVLPGSGGNSAFTMTPPIGCNSMDVDFEAIFQSSDPVLYPLDFSWTVDGTTETNSNFTHNFSAPGIYPVKLDVIINEFYISSVSIIASGGWWGDIEELFSYMTPELYGVVNGVSLSEQGSGNSQTWSTDIPLSSTTLTSTFFDEDTGPPFGSVDDDLGSGSATIIPADGANVAITTSNYIASCLLNIRVAEVLSFWDTVKIYSNSTATITSSNGILFCEGDSTILDLGSSSYSFIQWYDDTTLLLGENGQTLTVNSNGNYFAEILETGNICAGNSNTIAIAIDNISTPTITQNSASLEIDNPNGYDVQWFSNGVPIPSATSSILTDLSSGSPFSVSLTNANGCSALSSDFTAIIAGTSTQSGNLLSESQNIIFEASGFNLCPGQEIAWVVSTQADGPVTNMAELQTAIDASWVYPSSSLNTFDANCISTEFPPGDYYMTPVSVDIPVIEDVYWNTSTDSAYCDASMEVCITLTGTEYKILPFEIVLPNGTTMDVLQELAGMGGIGVNPLLWQQALDLAGGGTSLCLDLIDLLGYYDNPNGDWIFKLPNVGSGDIDFSIDNFNIVVDASTCDSLATDQIIPMNGISGSVAAGETGSASSFTITVPPFPTDFPNVTPSCVLFGDATSFESTCVLGINDLAIENFNLYPNPNNGSFNLEFTLEERSRVELSILDLTGRTILNREYLNIQGDFREIFDLKNNLNKGFYIIDLKIGQKHVSHKFIVK